MGSSYSDLNIYFLLKNGSYGCNKYNISIKREYFDKCRIFEKITHKIEFINRAKPSTYNIILYDGCSIRREGNYVFGYYYPGDDNESVKEIHVYYSVFAPDDPLVVSFFVKGGQTFNCIYSELEYAGWDYASKITKYNFREGLSEKLSELYRGISLNKTIQFITDKEVKTTISERTDDIDESFKRWIYTPNGPEESMGIKDLFKNIKPKDVTNKLDYSYVSQVKGRYFDGIIVYCAEKGMALLLEFYEKCETKRYVRKDKNATYWAKEDVQYTDDKTLKQKLNSIKEEANKKEIVTYILDRFDKYNEGEGEVNVEVDESVKKSSYTIYKHKPKSGGKEPNFVFKGEKIKEFDEKIKDKKPITLDVYYLKVNDIRDTSPFLLVLSENGDKNQQPTTQSNSAAQPTPTPASSAKPNSQAPAKEPSKPETSKQSCYHLGPTVYFKDWQELSGCISLEEKLKKIEDSARCPIPLQILRSLAYKILTEKKEPEKKVPPVTTEERPEVTPEKMAVGTSLSVIFGSVAGALVASGVIGGSIYGIYWYNTTIKLLT